MRALARLALLEITYVLFFYHQTFMEFVFAMYTTCVCDCFQTLMSVPTDGIAALACGLKDFPGMSFFSSPDFRE